MSLDDVTFLVAGWKFLPALQVEFIELISSMKLSDRMWFSPLSKMPNVLINSSNNNKPDSSFDGWSQCCRSGRLLTGFGSGSGFLIKKILFILNNDFLSSLTFCSEFVLLKFRLFCLISNFLFLVQNCFVTFEKM